MYNDFLFDLETFGSTSRAAVIDLSAIPFDPNPEVLETFDELVSRGRRFKFDLKSQKGKRLFSKGTIEWWKTQSAEARKNLAPKDDDYLIVPGIIEFLEFLSESGVDKWKSYGYCRGQSFDFPILTDMIREIQRAQNIPEEDIDTFHAEPVKFWNQRDVRTSIEDRLLVRGQSTCPLPLGTLNGFVAHDSIHDCAKDILMLKYALRYALGIEEAPSKENTDPLSLPTR